MQQLVEYILAAMIAHIPPGQSSFSQVPLEVCDTTCQTTPRCESTHDFRCKPPTLNMSLYLQKQDELVAAGTSQEEAIEAAHDLSFTRPETYEEGLARYYVIAEAMVASSRKNSYTACVADSACKDKTSEEVKACYVSCSNKSRWQNKPEQLAWSLFTVSSFESGWRSDVHAGVGWAGRGDCSWAKDGAKVPAWTDGGRPVPGTCNSYGLNQAWFGNPARTLHTYFEAVTYDSVLGLDYASTVRSFDLASRQLFTALYTCRGADKDWAWPMFSLYGSGASCRVESAKKRSFRFWQTSGHPTALPEKHREALESEKVQELVQLLMTAETHVLWMPAEPKAVPKPSDERLAAN